MPPSPTQLKEWEQKLRTYLTDKKLKFTEQRWAIARSILNSGGHLDAQGILKRVKLDHGSIGAATVYRCIKVLCDADLLQESLQDMNRRVVFELPDVGGHHDHIICTDCGEIFEFHDDRIEEMQISIAKEMNFSVNGHKHVIHASCDFLKKNS
jgi:Fur family transcriptional regulator, ferric uptake regulator